VKGLRIYADEHGESHVEELTIDLSERTFAPPAAPLMVSDPQEVRNVLFCEVPQGWNGSWHPTPVGQYFFLLRGMLEGEVSDGAVRRLRPGEFALLEDTTGKGHATRVVGDSAATGVFTQLPV
jgi:hypothetical protein